MYMIIYILFISDKCRLLNSTLLIVQFRLVYHILTFLLLILIAEFVSLDFIILCIYVYDGTYKEI